MMADIFTRTDIRRLLEKKNVWLFGDSNMRGTYKDIIWLLEKNSLIDLNSLRGKLEGSYLNDNLIKGGILHCGRNYQEIRRYKNFSINLNIEFTFLTQCMSADLQKKLNSIETNGEIPDVIVLNSCLWDITRWGPDGVEKYKKNILALMKLLKSTVPYQTRVVWLTTPPISHEPRGGFFIKQIDFLKHTLRFDVMEANFFVSREVILHGFDVVDIHYHLLLQIHRRQPDGIHWSPEAMRHITNLLLTHLCFSWGCSLPQNFKSPLLKKLAINAPGSKDPKPSEPLKFVLDVPKSSNIMLSQKTKSPRNRGKKRKRRGNNRDQNYNDFTKDVFDYDYQRKRFKVAPDDELIDELLFTEKLYVFGENGKRIGRFSLRLDQDDTAKQNKTIFVHISNRAYINGGLSESIVTGTVTTKMKTLEEIRYESSEMSNSGKQERCTFILREATKYYVSVTNTICDMKHQTHYTLAFAECLGMIGECANALLLRRLATKGFEGILQLKTILSNGKRCKNYYVTKLSEHTMNGKRMQVMIVYRNVTNFKKLNITTTMALTRAGQLLYLFWSNSKCFLHVDPDCEINPRRFTSLNPPLERHWHKDVQLHSMYLDKVSSQTLFYRSSKYDNEPLRRILGDFLQYVLLKKPKNVICFAVDYFSAFGHNTMTKCPSAFKMPSEEFDYFFDKQNSGENYWFGEEYYFFQSP